MSWNGAGTWSAPSLPGTFNPAITGQQATAADWNTFLAALSGAQGISNLICKDGQTTPTANLPMGGFRHTGVGNPNALTQYGTVGDIINTGYIYGDDVGAADAYKITLPVSLAAYAKGQIFRTVIANTNLTAAPTFQVTGLSTGTISNAPIGSLSAGSMASLAVISLSGTTPTFQLLNLGILTGMSMRWPGELSTVPAGWLPMVGHTIGNATSNATQRANADTSALFALWYASSDANLPLLTSAGAATTRAAQGTSAAAFAANCQLTMPNYTDRFAIGAGGTNASVSTATGGASTVTLVADNLPPHAHSLPNVWATGGAGAQTGNTSNMQAVTQTGNGPGTSTPFSIVNPYIGDYAIVKL